MDNEEHENEGWYSLSIKRNNTQNTFIIEEGRKVEVLSEKTKKYLSAMEMRNDVTVDEDEEDKKLEAFIAKHNSFGTSVTRLTFEQIQTFGRIGIHRCILRSSRKDIVGCIFCWVVKLHYRNETKEIGCTTFLTVHNRFRNLGLGMTLIKQLIVSGARDYNIEGGYHCISTPKGLNAVEVKKWYRPIDHVKCTQTGYLPDSTKNIIMREKIYVGYTLKRTIIKIESEEDCQKSYDSYNKICNSYKFRFEPTYEDWVKTTQAFDCFMIGEGQFATIIIFMIFDIEVKNKITNQNEVVKFGWPLLIVGDGTLGLKYCVNYAIEKNLMILTLHEIGCCTKGALNAVMAMNSNSKVYLDFYNMGVTCNPGQIHIPII